MKGNANRRSARRVASQSRFNFSLIALMMSQPTSSVSYEFFLVFLNTFSSVLVEGNDDTYPNHSFTVPTRSFLLLLPPPPLHLLLPIPLQASSILASNPSQYARRSIISFKRFGLLAAFSSRLSLARRLCSVTSWYDAFASFRGSAYRSFSEEIRVSVEGSVGAVRGEGQELYTLNGSSTHRTEFRPLSSSADQYLEEVGGSFSRVAAAELPLSPCKEKEGWWMAKQGKSRESEHVDATSSSAHRRSDIRTDHV